MSAWMGDDLPTAAELRDDMRTRIADLTARLAAAEARAEAAESPDAASARHANLSAAQSRALEQIGERRATAAIVAWLATATDGRGLVEYRDCWNIAAMIERGDHIKPGCDDKI